MENTLQAQPGIPLYGYDRAEYTAQTGKRKFPDRFLYGRSGDGDKFSKPVREAMDGSQKLRI